MAKCKKCINEAIYSLEIVTTLYYVCEECLFEMLSDELSIEELIQATSKYAKVNKIKHNVNIPLPKA